MGTLFTKPEAALRVCSRRFALIPIGACATVACAIACSSTEPHTPSTSLTVNVVMVGNGADSDGFVVRAAGKTLSFSGAGTQVVPAVPRGPYTLELSGLAGNCATDTATLLVAVTDKLSATATFTVECYGGFAYTAERNNQVGVYYLDENGRTSQIFAGGEAVGVRDWSADGAYALIQRFDDQGHSAFWVVARNGGFTRQLSPNAPNFQAVAASFSPDGSRILYTRTGGLPQLRVTDVQGTFDRALFSDSTSFFDGWGSWSPDGSRIAFITSRFLGGRTNLATVRADGTGGVSISQRLSFGETTAWSPDGQFVAAEIDTVTGVAPHPFIALTPAAGGAFTPAFLNPLLFFNSSDFSWSPDGTKLAVAAQVDNTLRVFVVNRDGSTPIAVTPTSSVSSQPSWSKDGTRLLFIGTTPPGNQPAVFVARPDGTHAHPVVEQALLSPTYPAWNRTATPGMHDR